MSERALQFEAFSIVTTQDVARLRLETVCTGPIDSVAFVDDQIAHFRRMDAPWLFDRLVDLTACTGFVAYEDLARMARYFDTIIRLAPRPLRNAVVSDNRMVAARMPTVDLLFRNQEFRAFSTRAEAEAWFDAPRGD